MFDLDPRRIYITIAGCFAGIASAAACGCGVSLSKAITTLVLAVLAQSIADTAAARARRPSTAVPRDLRWRVLALLAIGTVLAVHSGGGLIVIGAAGLLLIWATWSRALGLAWLGLGEIALGVGAALVMIGAHYVQRGSFFIIPTVAAVSFALMATSSVLAEHAATRARDAEVGLRTWPVRLGARASGWAMLALVLAAHLWLALSVWWLIPPPATLAALASLPLGLWAALRVMRGAGTQENTAILAAFAVFVHAIGLTAGFVWVVLER